MLKFVHLMACTIALGGCAVAAPVRDLERTSTARWSERGVFVFGGIVLDFQLKMQRAGVFNSQLEDCSDGQYFCAKSDFISVVLPRRCEEVRPGQRFASSGIQTEVMAVSKEISGHPPLERQIAFLRSTSLPGTIFVYEPKAGIVAILFDPSERGDGKAWDSRGVEAFYKDAALGSPGSAFLNRRTTIEPMGPCDPSR